MYSNFSTCYEPEPDEENIVLETRRIDDKIQAVERATLVKMIEFVTENILSASTIEFISTYISITDANNLMQLLKCRFNTKLVDTSKLPIIRRGVVTFLEIWITEYPDDFDDHLCKELTTFIRPIRVHNYLFQDTLNYNFTVIPRQIPASQPVPCIIKLGRSVFRTIDENSILEYDTVEIARQLCLLAQEAFCTIKRSELVNQTWNKKRDANMGVHKLIQLINHLSEWVVYEILKRETPKERAKAMGKIITIALECKKLFNFSTVFAIVGGLSNASIDRLKKTYKLLKEKHKRGLLALTEFTGSRFMRIREAHNANHTPTIPFIGLYLTDLTFIDDGNAQLYTYLTNGVKLYNFRKQEQNSRILRKIKRDQEGERYNFQVFPQLRELLLNVPVQDEQTIWQISLKREPRKIKKSFL
jgi:son of sevenless-like protein